VSKLIPGIGSVCERFGFEPKAEFTGFRADFLVICNRNLSCGTTLSDDSHAQDRSPLLPF